MAYQVKLVLAGLLATLLTLGTYEHLYNLEPNRCEMTYMYQRPHFIPIELPAEVAQRFPLYGLYVYGEGDSVENLEKKIYSGVPVLFVPGNGGSHKQVRSLASVAYRKSFEDGINFHFNFFTVDLNEELAALYGPVLEQQTEFVAIVVKHILGLYAEQKGGSKKPESVILVGHSMGGMVARAVYTTKLVTSAMAPLIITQATPHTRPVLVLDPHIEHFYEKVNVFWIMERQFDLKDVVLVTVGGGRNDIQVPTSHTNTPLADLATTTADIPSCWLTADHQAVVWCWQLVMATMRALFDCVDPATLQLTTNRTQMIDVFDFHLSKRITGKRYKQAFYPDTIQLEPEATWTEVTKRQFTHVAVTTPRRSYLAIPLRPGHPQHHHATIIANNLDNKNWVVACTASATPQKGGQPCSLGLNLSSRSQKMLGKMKAVEVDLAELGEAGYTHVVVIILPSDEKVAVAVDVHSQNGRYRSTHVPTFFRSFAQTLVVDTTPQKALSYNVTLNGFSDGWQSLKLILKPRQSCHTPEVPMARLYIPWTGKVSFLQNSGPGVSYTAELDVPDLSDNTTLAPSVQFTLNPECTYSILVQGDFVGVFRRLVLVYGYQIPTYIAVHLLLSLTRQLRGIGDEGQCPSLFTSMLSLTPVAVVPFIKIGSIFLKNMEVEDDLSLLSTHGEDLPLLPIVLFLGCLPLSLLLGAATWGMILLAGKGAHSFMIKVLGRTLGATDMLADLAVMGLSKVPVIVGVSLISLAYSTCGTLALSLALVFYFLKVSKQYEEYIERLAASFLPGQPKREASTARALSRVHFHLTLLMLLGVVTTLHLPTLVIWSRLLRTNKRLPDDPSLGVAVALLLALCFLWQKKMPQPTKRFYKPLSYVIHALAIVGLLFGSVHIYRVSYLVAATLALLAAHQLLSPEAPQEPTPSSTPDTPTQPYMEDLGSEDTDQGFSGHSKASTPSSDFSQ
ncbi:GPI inositol-deacylase-like isoform X2 [Eriocheir sinensis]|uniref:GPI inositol-deacylase-like isoform X2 n=1 Tax=Eriocheir sinensis TaxID=95602 RepID=UPI0021C8A862|nr:GPI inositol-deacylase-like isoform X2 [Eriocheir sinensis]